MKATKIDAILIGIVFLALFVFVGVSHAKKNIEISPYVDFNATIHGGIGDHYDGFGISAGFGSEFLYVLTDQFAIGINGKTNINGDYYLAHHGHDSMVDEYGTWTGSLGGIMYIGDMFYMSYMAIINLDTFHHSTYLHTDYGDIDMSPESYRVDPVDYCMEFGLRMQYHASMYVSVTTHLVENEYDLSKYQVYIGLKYHI